MSLDFNILSGILLVSGLATLFLSVLIFERLERSIRSFSYIILVISIWAISYAIELSSTTLRQMIFCTSIEYIGIALLPAFWITSIIKFTGNRNWLSVKTTALIFFIPVTTLCLVWTNKWHHLFYTDVSVDTNGPFPLIDLQVGPWYIINTVYFYAQLLWGLYLLITRFNKKPAIFKKQKNIILLGTAIPCAFNLVYQFGLRPYGHLDLTPFTFIITSFIISFGLFRYRLFDMVPIAREKVIEAMCEGVLVLDRHDRVIDLNPEMKRILQPLSDDIIGSNIKNILPGAFAADNILLKQTRETTEIRLGGYGAEQIFAVTITPLFEKDVYSGKIVLFNNITELYDKEAIKQLMNKKDEFLSIASHELKTPITSMKGYLQIMEKIAEKEGNPVYKTFISKANRQANKLTGLIGDLLDVSRIEAGKMQYNITTFTIGEVLEDCITFANNHSPEHKVNIQGDTSIRLKGDKHRIEQVICNLLSNAIKYSPDCMDIVLDMSQDEGMFNFSVTDCGVGIPKEKQGGLFSKFYRAESNDYKFTGLGLGLFISNEIISRHGGTIQVQSQEGKGSVFSFTLPL